MSVRNRVLCPKYHQVISRNGAKSNVWQFFGFPGDESGKILAEVAICQLCRSPVSSKATSNLWSHLRCHHPLQHHKLNSNNSTITSFEPPLDGKDFFTVTEEEKLVEIIPKYPCIYDASIAQHKDQSVKDKAWKEVAEIVGRSVDDCKKRWKNIRDTYYKRQKKVTGECGTKGKKWPLADSLTFLNIGESTSSTLSGGTHSQEEATQFPSTSSTNDTQSQTVEEIPISSRQISRVSRETSHSPRTSSKNIQSHDLEHMRTFRRPSKRSRLYGSFAEQLDTWGIDRDTMLKIMAEERRDDDVDLFFKSIATSVKKLRPDLINQAKMKTLQMVIELENENSLEFIFPHEQSRSPSADSHLTSSPSSVDITIKAEFDDDQFPNVQQNGSF